MQIAPDFFDPLNAIVSRFGPGDHCRLGGGEIITPVKRRSLTTEEKEEAARLVPMAERAARRVSHRMLGYYDDEFFAVALEALVRAIPAYWPYGYDGDSPIDAHCWVYVTNYLSSWWRHEWCQRRRRMPDLTPEPVWKDRDRPRWTWTDYRCSPSRKLDELADLAKQSPDTTRVVDLLDSLPSDELRDIAYARWVEGESPETIAARHGRKRRWVQLQLQAARRILQNSLRF
jgi:DNA-directed RNA polymerase specialized sigma24 family protein